MAMDEQELESLLRSHHWSINRTTTGNQKAFSARRGSGKNRVTRYIATEQKLREMSTEDVLAKLSK